MVSLDFAHLREVFSDKGGSPVLIDTSTSESLCGPTYKTNFLATFID